MRRGRKILVAVLVICMVVGSGVWPGGKERVQAASVFGDFEYEVLGDGTVSITKYNGADKEVTVPEMIDGKKVSSIGDQAFKECLVMTNINLPIGVESIGDWTFEECSNLTEINLPAGLSSIGYRTFAECSSLTKINLPTGLSHIGDYAFSSCSNLARISMPSRLSSIGDGTFSGCSSLLEISLPTGLSSIGHGAFLSCSSLSEIGFPIGLGSIGIAAFSDCSSLTRVTLQAGLTNIGGGAFGFCSSLREISLPKELVSIDESAFYECTNLTDVYYVGLEVQWNQIQIDPKNNDNLKNAAIHFNSGVNDPKNLYDYQEKNGTIEITKYKGTGTEAAVPETIDNKAVTSIGNEAFFSCQNLTKITLPTGITSIEDGAFRSCTGLTQINLPTGLLNLGDGAFKDCTGLTQMDLPAGITNMGFSVFRGCTSLAQINLPTGITSINDGAFADCISLKKISIPTGVTSIEDGVFTGCSSLSEINLPVGLNSIGDAAFQNCAGLTDVYYDGLKEQWDQIQIGLDNIELQNATMHFKTGSDDDFTNLYEYKEKSDGTIEITKYKGAETEVEVPEKINNKTVSSIGNEAFSQNEKIKKVRISQGITSIGGGVFSDCSNLSTIELPSGLTNIGIATFQSCIGLTSVELPEGVTAIKGWTFADCRNLSSISIPVSVTEIEYATIGNLYKYKLKDIYYAGSKEQWDAILFDGSLVWEDNDFSKIKIHYGITSPDDPVISDDPSTIDAAKELERLKTGDTFALSQDFQHYLSEEQMDIMESYLYTWLAEINYVYQYSGSGTVKERIMKKAGIDPQGNFASGNERAITHICVETQYGSKTFEVTLDLGKPDENGNLYPDYGAMHYEILEKENIPSDIPKSGQIGRNSYTELGTFVQCVSKASEDSLHNTYQWESLNDEMTSGVLVDKTVTEIIGNKNGSFSDAVFTIYAKPFLTYSKKVTIACPVDVHIYGMDGKEAGAIIDNKPSGGNKNVRLDVNGDTKTVYLAGNDYYLNLHGTDTGTMRYEVEEIANEEVRRNVQFLELQLQKDMQYEGYVFRPLNIDRDLYALRIKGGSGQEVFYADEDTYQALFKRIRELSLSQGETSLERNKTVQLSASMIPLDASNPNLQWTTDSESVVKVDNSGLVTAVGSGRATVTVSTKDGSFLKQYCVIDVADNKDFSSTSPGWSGGSSQPVEQQKNPVVVNLHYVLQFQTNGGTNLSRKTMTLLADDSPGIMPKVQKKDYLFDGWYTQLDGGEKITGEKPLKEAATLYAKWIKVTPPAKTTATLKSKKKGQVQVGFQNINAVSGYQIEYALNKKFTSLKTKEAGKTAKLKTISGLKAGKKYYVRVRAYQLDSMKKRIYGDYSEVKSVKVKG